VGIIVFGNCGHALDGAVRWKGTSTIWPVTCYMNKMSFFFHFVTYRTPVWDPEVNCINAYLAFNLLKLSSKFTYVRWCARCAGVFRVDLRTNGNFYLIQ